MSKLAFLFGLVLTSAYLSSGGRPALARQPLAPAPAVVIEPAPAIVVEQLFVPPTGLTMDVRRLLWELGYLASPNSVANYPFTYRFCLEVAVKCHAQGRYTDSLAFIQRAVSIRPTTSALYLQALNEVALDLSDNAVMTLRRLSAPETIKIEYEWLREKMSSPLTVRINLLLEVL